MRKIKDSYLELFESLLEHRELYLFGAGEISEKFLEIFQYSNQVQGICDNDDRKWRQGAIPIISPRELMEKDVEKVIVIISCAYYDAIKMQLGEMGVTCIFDYALWGPFSRQRNAYWGNYVTWQEAQALCRGYDDQAIFEKVKTSTREVMERKAVFERDSVCFFEADYNYNLLASLSYIGMREQKLTVLDFGGSLGSTYFQNRDLLKCLEDFTWNVVEQEHFAQYGEKYIVEREKNRLKFFYNIEELSGVSINCVLASSSLQYMDAPYTYLDKLLSLKPLYLVIDRMPLVETKDSIAIQKVPKEIYEAEYPLWLLNKDKLFSHIMKEYELLFEWKCKEVMYWHGGDRDVFYYGGSFRRRDGK